MQLSEMNGSLRVKICFFKKVLLYSSKYILPVMLLYPFVYTAIRHIVIRKRLSVRQHGLLWRIGKISAIMWIFEGVWVIFAKPPLLHSFYESIKMFSNSPTVLNQQATSTEKGRPCSLLSNTFDGRFSVCLVLGRQGIHLLFLSIKTVWITKLGFGLMVSGVGIKFILYSKIFLFL